MDELERAHEREVHRLGVIAAFSIVFPATAFAFLVALQLFWWCPEGGCPLVTWPEKARLLGNVLGLIALIIVFSLVFQFLFVLISRMFYAKKTVEGTFFRVSIPLFGWYEQLMRKWVNFLWRT